jgi:hypothetical protein
MKRLLFFFAAFFLCGSLAGCGSDTHDGLVRDTIDNVKTATSKVTIVKTEVDAAIKLAQDGKKLDLAKAIDATKELKDVGEKAQDIRRRIERVRAQITDEERKANFEKHKGELNTSFTELLKANEELRTAMAAAEKLDQNAKAEVKVLHEKLVEAQSPFEALARN